MSRTLKSISIILSFLMIVGVFSVAPIIASAESFTSGDWEYTLMDSGEAKIIHYAGSETELTVPDKIDGYTVSEIGTFGSYDSVFGNHNLLTKVNIPNTVTTLDVYAFKDCVSLISISIPDSVTRINYCAFSGCKKLKSVIIPNSVTYIGRNAFSSCSNLSDVEISNNVKEIGESAFLGCGLESVTIPDSVTSIKNGAFSYCDKITEITIPDSVESIGASAFAFCENLMTIVLPDSLKEIGDSAFINTAYYYNDSNWEENALYIGKHFISLLFSEGEGSNYSDNYVIKDGTLTIAGNAFLYSEITGVTIPDSVTRIGYQAFLSCNNLKSVTLSSNVISISDKAFGYSLSGKNENFVVKGHVGSEAERYANDNGFKFINLDEETTEPNETGTIATVTTNSTESTTNEIVQSTTVEPTEVTTIEETEPVTTQPITTEPSSEKSSIPTTTEPSTSITTDPAEGLDEYGYYINDYYLAGRINGEDKGLSNVDKNLRFTKDEHGEYNVNDVELKAGDSVRVVLYKGNNIFEIRWEDKTISADGKYRFSMSADASSLMYGVGDYSGTGAVGYGESDDGKVISKKTNPVRITSKTKSLKPKKLKKKAQTVKPIAIKNAKGTVKVTKVKSGTTAKIYKKIKVNSKTGAITFKKGKYAKKTYKVKLKITVSGNSTYKSKTLYKTVKVKVK